MTSTKFNHYYVCRFNNTKINFKIIFSGEFKKSKKNSSQSFSKGNKKLKIENVK